MPENRLTGGLDTSSYPQFGSGNKLMAPPDQLAGDSAGVGLMQQLQQLDSSKFDLLQKQTTTMHDIYSSVASDPSIDNITNKVSEARMRGIPNEAIMSGLKEFSQAYDPGTKSYDPKIIQQIAMRHLTMLADVNQRLEMSGRAAPKLVQDGDKQVLVAPGSGNFQGAPVLPGAIPNRLGPNERTRTQTVTNPDGSTTAIPFSKVYDDRGYVQPGATPAMPRPAPLGNGASPQAPLGRNTKATVAPPAASGFTPPAGPSPGTIQGVPGQPDPGTPGPQAANGPPVGFTTSLPPSMVADQKTSTDQFAADRADLPAGQQRLFALEQASEALRGTKTGKGTAARNAMLQYVAAAPYDLGKYFSGDPASLTNFDLAAKLLTAVQLSQPGANRSDQGQSTAGKASPNVEMNPAAARTVVADMIGQERLKQARTKQFIANKGNPADYANTIATDWDHDPRGYALSVMDPAERAEMFNKMSGPEKAKFLKSVRGALASGVLRPEDVRGAVGGQ